MHVGCECWKIKKCCLMSKPSLSHAVIQQLICKATAELHGIFP